MRSAMPTLPAPVALAEPACARSARCARACGAPHRTAPPAGRLCAARSQPHHASAPSRARACRAAAAARRPLSCQAAAGGESELPSASDELGVSGLQPLDSICDDFVCKSSPAIESTLRQMARDIDNVREGEARSGSPLAENVLYTDALFARVRGKANLRAFAPLAATVAKPRAAVTSMRMDALDTASITWTLAAETPAGPVNLTCRSVLTLNLITGRVLTLRDSWSFAATSPPAMLLFTARRLAYNLAQTASAAATDAGNAASAATASTDAPIYGDPADPMKFFQQQDTSFQDGVQLALVLAVLYTIVQGLRLANGV